MLLIVLLVLDLLMIAGMVIHCFINGFETNDIKLIFLLIGLMLVAVKINRKHRKIALMLAGFPILLPVLIVGFLAVLFWVQAVFH